MEYVSSKDAPKAIGPYSQAIKANGLLFTSGQVALDPASGELVSGDFSSQVRRVFDNLSAVLRASGTDFKHVTRATVYLINMANFQAMNTIYAEYFGDHKPARTTVGVSQLPKGAQIEIDLVAVV